MTACYTLVHLGLAFGLTALQTLPSVLAVTLIGKHPVLAVLCAVLSLAVTTLLLVLAASKLYWRFTSRSRTQPSQSTRRPIAISLIFALVSALAWLAHMLVIEKFGVLATVSTTLIAGLAAIILTPLIHRSKLHGDGRSITKIIACCLAIAAYLLIVQPHITHGAGPLPSAFNWSVSVWALPLLFVGVCVMTLLRPVLSSSDEAVLWQFKPFTSVDVVAIEISSAALLAWMINLQIDGGRAVMTVFPAQIDPGTWNSSDWSLVWIGVFNTAFVLIVLNTITNRIGVQVATAAAQSRPVFAEGLQIALGLSAFSAQKAIILTLASVLFAMSAWLLLPTRIRQSHLTRDLQ